MFYASLIGCHLMMKNACFEMRDDRGPYETEKQCEERIDEMLADTIKMWLKFKSPIAVTGWKCEKKDGVST